MSKLNITGRLLSVSTEQSKSGENFKSLKVQSTYFAPNTGENLRSDDYELLVFANRIDEDQLNATVGKVAIFECYVNGRKNESSDRTFYNVQFSCIKISQAYERSTRN